MEVSPALEGLAPTGVQNYLHQYEVLENRLTQTLYTAILKRFRLVLGEKECESLQEYQNQVFDLVENLRESQLDFIAEVFTWLGENDPCLADIIIMQWSLPRPNYYLSKQIYDMRYRENINKYNPKLSEMIEHPVLRNFCLETLTKTNYVPVHCIDFVWFYMVHSSFELVFYSEEDNHYIGFTPVGAKSCFRLPTGAGLTLTGTGIAMSESDEDEYIEFGLDLAYILNMGLGKIVYANDPHSKGSFRNFMKRIVTDQDLIQKFSISRTGKNYLRQLAHINRNFDKYFLN